MLDLPYFALDAAEWWSDFVEPFGQHQEVQRWTKTRQNQAWPYKQQLK